MRFDPRTITVTDHKGRTSQIDALVALHDDGTPVGLAVHPVYILGPDPAIPQPNEYTVTHVPGGVRLHSSPVPTEDIACRWLTLIAPLADWRQSSEVLHTLDTLRLRVWMARAQALTECEQEWEASPPLSSFPLFRLEALTPFLEWVSYAMEYVTLPQEAKPALDTLLDWHSEVSRQFNGSTSLPDSLPVALVVS